MKHNLEIGKNCFVRLPTHSFPGIVMELREGWVRVAGRGDCEWDGDDGCVHSSRFDDWFKIDAACVQVKPA
jgi:hypothetical protein